MSGIVNIQNLQDANTAFRAAFDEFFADGPVGVSDQFTEFVPNDAQFFENDVTTSFPRVREWLGSKVFKELRAYTQRVTVTKYESSIKADRLKVEYDAAGVARQLGRFVQQSQYWYDDILINRLIDNDLIGYDGVSLLNDSHPHVSGTADNLYTDALSFSQKKTVIQNMELITDEDGKPLGVMPTHLLVGPKLRQTAMEITGSDRLVAVGNTGTLDATSSVVAVGTLQNYVGGDINVLISPWITGTQYFFMDLSKPGLRPLGFAENRAPTPVEQTEPTDESRFLLDEYRWSIESDGVPFAGLWQLIAGKVAA